MAKVALLIGVSNYGEGLSSLPGTQQDISTLQKVLENPQVGGFETVDVLPNPNRTDMEGAIEKLFSENRSRDDLILLYFSGHGVRDDSGVLYLATNITAKNSQGRIFTSTAVSSDALQRYMSQSRSKRQVLILDCCFSGAFANDMKAKDDESIDIKAQLGSEGRAVLTSSAATQVSYEKEGTSIYTRYLVQGLETGAADLDANKQITVDELHEYAREKVQEAAPSMRPEIYAVREGYKIIVARALQGDPLRVFRKEVDERAKQKRGKISRIDRRALSFRSRELGVSAQEAETVIHEVLQPYEAFWVRFNEFEEAVKETLEDDPQLNSSSIDDLQYCQRMLKLRDEDISPILRKYQIDLAKPATKSSKSPSFPTYTEKGDEYIRLLPSEKGIDYRNLQKLLETGQWEKADRETAKVMLQAMEKESWFDVRSNDLLNFPCQDLKTIDSLWVKYSKGKFGFSVQKDIYLECGGVLDGKYHEEAFKTFGDRVRWRENGKWEFNVTFDTSVPKGHLPGIPSGGSVGGRVGR